MLAFPLGLLIIVLGPDFTLAVLGEKWMPMVPALQIMGVYGMIHSVGGALGPVFIGMGRPDLLTKLLFVKLLILAALIFPLIPVLKIFGAALAVTIATVIMNPISDVILMRLIKLPVRSFLRALVPGLAAGAAAALPALAVYLTLSPGWLRLAGELAGALTGYVIAVIIMQRTGLKDIFGELRNSLTAPDQISNE
jgi:O-antigen/teichoic acid export membrane protein